MWRPKPTEAEEVDGRNAEAALDLLTLKCLVLTFTMEIQRMTP